MLTKIVRRIKTTLSPKPVQKEQLCMRLNLNNYQENYHLKLPQNYSFNYYQNQDEKKWVELLNKSEDFGSWNLQRLNSEIIHSLINNGGIFVYFNNDLIGCSSICKIDGYLPAAVLMYVFVTQDHRGKNIGKSMVSKALEIAKEQNYPEVVLKTDDFRRSAIKVYLTLGFLPNIDASIDAYKRWNKLINREFGIEANKYLIEKDDNR